MSIEELASRFSCSTQTIRRDVRDLAEGGMVRRYHGGIAPVLPPQNTAYGIRRTLLSREKRNIAHLVAKHIPADASIVLDIGTTSEAIAVALARHEGLRVITNNLNVAHIMRSNETCDILIAAGRLRRRDNGVTGDSTVEFLNQYRPDIGIITLSSIDHDGTLLDFDTHEVRVTKAIIQNSRRVFLAADHSKFGREAMVRLGHISEVDAFFTDQIPPQRFCKLLEDCGVSLYTAED